MAGSITAPTPGPGAYAPPAESSGVYVRSQRPIAPTPTASTTISAATTRPANFNAYRHGAPFLASFTLHNSGHFGVTVEGLEVPAPGIPPWVGPEALLTTSSVSQTAPVGHTAPFQSLSLSPGDTAVVVVRFKLVCPRGGGRVASVYADSVKLRYRYLRWFDRTQTVRLPFAVTLRCIGGPSATP